MQLVPGIFAATGRGDRVNASVFNELFLSTVSIVNSVNMSEKKAGKTRGVTRVRDECGGVF